MGILQHFYFIFFNLLNVKDLRCASDELINIVGRNGHGDAVPKTVLRSAKTQSCLRNEIEQSACSVS